LKLFGFLYVELCQLLPKTLFAEASDNGPEFTDRLQRPDKKPSGNHLFDQVCSENNVDHRLIKPYHP